jgi:hypothetical protein
MRLLALVATVPAACLAACGGGSAPPDADEALACISSGRGQTYAVDLAPAMVGTALKFKLASAVPAPPGFNDNTWIVQITTPDGTPVTGAHLVVTPFMPDHQHGTLPVKIEEQTAAGQYKLTPVNMWMPGYWEITIDATAGAAHDSALYKFCIQA